MSLERIRAQLEKFGLAKPDDEMSVTMMPVGPFLLFGDSTGDNLLIAREDYVSQRFNKISFNIQTLSREEFWSGRWLDSFMRYRGFEVFWAGLKADSLDVQIAAPRTSETTGIGRANGSALTGGFLKPSWGNTLLSRTETRKNGVFHETH